MFDTILVATDGSPPSDRAVTQAIELANELGSQLKIISVAETGFSPAGPEYPTETFYEMVDEIEEAAWGTVAAAVKKAKASGVAVGGYSRAGKRAQDAILETARAEDVDLIVIGTHGRSGVKRLLLGSVAEAVVRGSDRPVLIARGPDEPDKGS